MTEDQDATTGRPPRRCAWCGELYRPGPTGRTAVYCRRSCRQRAYEARRQDAAIAQAVAAAQVDAGPDSSRDDTKGAPTGSPDSSRDESVRPVGGLPAARRTPGAKPRRRLLPPPPGVVRELGAELGAQGELFGADPDPEKEHGQEDDADAR